MLVFNFGWRTGFKSASNENRPLAFEMVEESHLKCIDFDKKKSISHCTLLHTILASCHPNFRKMSSHRMPQVLQLSFETPHCHWWILFLIRVSYLLPWTLISYWFINLRNIQKATRTTRELFKDNVNLRNAKNLLVAYHGFFGFHIA